MGLSLDMDKKTLEKISKEFKRWGGKAYEVAKETILNEEKIVYRNLCEAIKYFIDLWHNFQHPTLLAIACKAVGGEPEKTTLIGAALVLLTGGVDIHDDVIDKSKMKGMRATVYGKFGEDLSIITGNVLLIEGLTLLGVACKNFPKEQGENIQKLVKQGLFELGDAVAEEASLKGNWNLDPEKYLGIIKRKAAIAEVATRIGAIVGGASLEEVEIWGKIGRIIGMSMNIRDEFVDIFEAEELKNRKNNECLPLPILYAMRDPEVRKRIIHLLIKKELTNNDATEVAKIVLETKDVKMFKAYMQNLISEGLDYLHDYKDCREVEILISLLELALKDL